MIVDRPVLDVKRPKIGIVGTGFISRQFAVELWRRRDDAEAPRLAGYLTRRPLDGLDLPQAEKATSSIDALIDVADLVFECTGDPLWAAQVVEAAMSAGKPVMTLNPEFHVTVGSAFVGRGYVTEADGDQPGCLASLREEAVAMGFRPLVYGNMKGFLNRNPSLADMEYWGQKQGISLPMVTSFTDGTKVQIEQVLVGNGFDGDILQEELLGPAGDDLGELGRALGQAAIDCGKTITDYVLSRSLPHGVFVVGIHDDAQRAALSYIKMGEGPFYNLVRPNILVHLEPFKTIARMQRSAMPLLDNGAKPRLSVAAVAKRRLEPGERIECGCGSFAMRGIAVRIQDRPNHLPIGLAVDIHIKRRIEPGQILNLDDVDLPTSRALELWQGIERAALDG